MLLEIEPNWPVWIQLAMQLPILALLIAVMVLLYKLAPTWKELRFQENEVRHEAAQAIGALAHAVEVMSADHRQVTETTEELRLFLRVSNRENRHLSERLAGLERETPGQR